MTTELERQLIQIGQRITDGTASYDDLATLQSHKREVLEMGDIVLCEQAGITEEEFNKGELNPDLTYDKGIIKLEIEDNGERNSLCRIVLEGEQKLVINCYELLELRDILNENIEELKEYFRTNGEID